MVADVGPAGIRIIHVVVLDSADRGGALILGLSRLPAVVQDDLQRGLNPVFSLRRARFPFGTRDDRRLGAHVGDGQRHGLGHHGFHHLFAHPATLGDIAVHAGRSHRGIVDDEHHLPSRNRIHIGKMRFGIERFEAAPATGLRVAEADIRVHRRAGRFFDIGSDHERIEGFVEFVHRGLEGAVILSGNLERRCNGYPVAGRVFIGPGGRNGQHQQYNQETEPDPRPILHSQLLAEMLF
ncbi:MAG: hypothetical protein BWY66_01332 [bacterium ADurb.Bin374]|nr:MAG: hypothetical protein BWY66_01332 [bacterium ADurb.Bin374]